MRADERGNDLDRVDPKDLETVHQQLGRPARATVDVAHRCPCGGPTVLRTSTAAAVALGALGVMTDRWSGTPPD